MDRLPGAIAAACRYLAPLVWQALTYTGRRALDLASLARMAYLWRLRRRAPGKSVEVDAKLAAIRESRAARWNGWRALPALRRLEVQTAVVALASIAFFAGRWYLHAERSSAPTPIRAAGRTNRAPTDLAAHDSIPAPAHAAPAKEADAIVLRRAVASAQQDSWILLQDAPAALAPGPLGSWDDFKVDSPVVFDTGSSPRTARYRLWYRGCRFAADEYSCAVGHATSGDGVVWTRAPQPAFAPSDPGDRERLDAIAIARGNNGYVLWYAVGPAWLNDRHFAVIRAATSPDGLHWLASPEPVYTAVAQGSHLRPAALWDGAQFHVWLIDSRSPFEAESQRFPEMPADGDDVIVHLTSPDGLHLAVSGATPIKPLSMDRVPLWVYAPGAGGGFRALFYERFPSGRSPQGVGVLRSRDGTTWERAQDEAMPLGVRDLGYGVVPESLAAVSEADGLFVWFVVRRDHGGESIRAVFRKDGR